MMLSEIIKNIANTLKFNHFDMAYVDVPIEKSKYLNLAWIAVKASLN